MNNIQPRYDMQARDNDEPINQSNNGFKNLFDDKQLYNDQSQQQKNKFKIYDDDELPSMKNDKKNKK